MTHTPGPWLITPELGCKDIGPDDVGCPDGIYAIAGTYGITPEAEDKDNAALIAAAPELLEACKTALSELEHAHSVADDCYDQVSGAMQEILNDMLPAEDDNTGATNKLRAAIARAEGEQ